MRFKLILITAVLATILLLTSLSLAQNLWQEGGVPVRQGDFIRWEKTSVVNDAGETFILWTDCRECLSHAYAQKFDIDGNPCWEEDGSVMGSAVLYFYSKPVICPSEDGGIIVVWMGHEEGLLIDDVKAQKFDAQGNIVWDAEGIDICTIPGESVYEPRIVTDGSNGAFIVWQDGRNTGNDRDIYALRILADGSRAPGWNENGNVVTTAAGEQSYWENNVVCSDGEGGMVVVWKDWRSTSRDIYSQRMSPEGAALWQVNGTPVCTFSETQERPNITPDGEGGYFIAWRDRRNFNQTVYDIYMSHIDADGNALWTTDGIPVCEEAGVQRNQRIVNDGFGGVYVIWEDFRNNIIFPDIYCQRIDSAGDLLWQSSGVPVCTEATSQESAEISRFGDDGFVAVWADGREGEYYSDVYSQFISASGQPLWQTDGISISSEEYLQNMPDLHFLPDNSIAYFWVDWRNDSPDIYCQKVDAGGNIQLQLNGATVIEGLDGNAYNPLLLNFPDD